MGIINPQTELVEYDVQGERAGERVGVVGAGGSLNGARGEARTRPTRGRGKGRGAPLGSPRSPPPHASPIEAFNARAPHLREGDGGPGPRKLKRLACLAA